MTEVPFRFSGSPLMWQMVDVLSTGECTSLVELIEAAEPAPASANASFRDQDRILVDAPSLAAKLFARMRPGLPPALGPLTLVGLNERLRLYRYRPGQRFLPHMDHWYHPDPRTTSLLTVLVYLNDEFEGGQTRFMEQLWEQVQPRRGAAAVFQHKVRHEGCSVLSGVKYALRTDVMYRAPSAIQFLGSTP